MKMIASNKKSVTLKAERMETIMTLRAALEGLGYRCNQCKGDSMEYKIVKEQYDNLYQIVHTLEGGHDLC